MNKNKSAIAYSLYVNDARDAVIKNLNEYPNKLLMDISEVIDDRVRQAEEGSRMIERQRCIEVLEGLRKEYVEDDKQNTYRMAFNDALIEIKQSLNETT